ncbi:pilin [Aliikangiella coralliicola]|uniref:Uncharacterized protein n=1 Tax=Aliikangiella coralliicola TaxID=2592383 RepID=A0A545U7M8_9GAMM|nr:pilin [Aliikangiella coralliicola]TQV85480.1 hypothetical protein FLL46_20155 [Aliikangiella coralliicola]
MWHKSCLILANYRMMNYLTWRMNQNQTWNIEIKSDETCGENMAKTFTIAILLVASIIAGLFYAIYSDPERHDHQLFELAIKTFANNAEKLEQEFQSSGTLPAISQTHSLSFTDLTNTQSTISLDMRVTGNAITLQFGDGESLLANQSILLEPFIANSKIRWKCIGGSALIRLRTKACRLGEGIQTQEIVSQ